MKIFLDNPYTEILAVLVLVIVDGLLKCHTPGSLREPARTYLFPQQWSTLPLSFGLLMCEFDPESLQENLTNQPPSSLGRS